MCILMSAVYLRTFDCTKTRTNKSNPRLWSWIICVDKVQSFYSFKSFGFFLTFSHPCFPMSGPFLLLMLLSSFLHADLPPENETSGYIFIHAEGGLNQQRIAVWMSNCNIIGSTLISLVLFQCICIIFLSLQPHKMLHWYFVGFWYICFWELFYAHK